MTNRAVFASPLRSRPNTVWAAYMSSGVVTWLLVSAFLWSHTDAQRDNTWIVGLLMMIAAFTSPVIPLARFANTILAAWLFASTVVFGGSAATLVNNLAVALVGFGLSLIPVGKYPRSPLPPHPPGAG